jgi:hypothetical protein
MKDGKNIFDLSVNPSNSFKMKENKNSDLTFGMYLKMFLIENQIYYRKFLSS